MVDYRLELIDSITKERLLEMYESLSDFRKEKADALKIEEKKKQSIVAGFLLEDLFRECEIPEPFEYEVSENGKPSLKDEKIWFSLSHTKGLVAVVISDEGSIGIDAEQIKEANLSIIERFCTEEEAQWLSEAPEEERLEDFFKIWTFKEAVVKLFDLKLTEGLRDYSYLDETLEIGHFYKENYVITICSKY